MISQRIRSELYSLTKSDFVKGLVVAAFSGLVSSLYAMISAPGFDLTQADWSIVGKAMALAAIAYLGKQFSTSSDGKLFGVYQIDPIA